MTSHSIATLLLAAVNMAFLAVLIGIVASWSWIVGRLFRDRPLLPASPFRSHAATWGIGTVIAILVLEQAASLLVVDFSPALLGIDVAGLMAEIKAEATPPDLDPDLTPEDRERISNDRDVRSARLARQQMVVNTAVLVAFLVAFPLVFRAVSSAHFSDLGLTTEHLRSQIGVGVVGGLAIIPVCNLVHTLALQIFPTNPHPVEKMLRHGFDTSTAVLGFLSAVVLAPLMEETVFRGVIQQGLGNLGFLKQPPFHAGGSTEDAQQASTQQTDLRLWIAIAATSLFFAARHGAQWPSPIPLFIFSSFLGYLFHRTGSLLTAIVYHAVFNGFSMLMILGQQLESAVDKPAAPAPTPIPAPVALIWEWVIRLST